MSIEKLEKLTEKFYISSKEFDKDLTGIIIGFLREGAIALTYHNASAIELLVFSKILSDNFIEALEGGNNDCK